MENKKVKDFKIEYFMSLIIHIIIYTFICIFIYKNFNDVFTLKWCVIFGIISSATYRFEYQFLVKRINEKIL